MALTWSHTVLMTRDAEKMLDFYGRVLGFEVTDRGPLPDGREIVFLSQDPKEHHQLALVPGREDDGPPNTLAHLAFRTSDLAELRGKIAALQDDDVNLRLVSHGNTWSAYCQDPEGNGVEIFQDTPFTITQPQVEPWDPTLDDDALLAWTEATFEGRPGFGLRDA